MALVLLLAVATTYWMHIAIVVLLNITYTVALFSVLRMGYLSLGHAGFIALGAYTCVVLTVRLDISPWWGILGAGVMSGTVAWGLGAMTMRLRGIYFSLAIFVLWSPVAGARPRRRACRRRPRPRQRASACAARRPDQTARRASANKAIRRACMPPKPPLDITSN